MRRHAIARQYLFALGVSVLLAAPCAASPQVSLSVGFDQQVVRNTFTPFEIEIAGLASPVDGTLKVRQSAGLPGERRAEIVHVIQSGTIENGTLRATLPLVEPLNPVTVELVAQDGRTVAVAEQSLRLGVRQWAYPLTVGRPTGIASAAVVGAEELPLDWWAYDAVREVWLVDPPFSEPALQALGEWTVSGGSLLIVSGSAYPRMDSPTLRRLLPLSAPQLEEAEDGTFFVGGAQRAEAETVLKRGVRPLLVQMPLGAGRVSLVTVALADLGPGELELIAERIPQAQRPPTTERVSAALLRSTRVPRPAYWLAPAVTGVTLASLVAFGLWGTRRRWTFGAFVGSLVALAAWSGFYGNSHKRFVREYSMITNVSVLSSFGINTAFSSFYAVEPRSVTMRHELGSFPAGGYVLGARGGTLSAESEAGQTRFALQAAERRDLLFHSRPAAESLRFRFDGTYAEIENRTGKTLANAYLAADDAILSLPAIQPGTQRLAVQTGLMLGEARSTYLSLRSILRPIEEWLPIAQRGVWLVTLEEWPEATDRDAPTLEREVWITILQGERT